MTRAEVRVAARVTGSIETGLLVLLGVGVDDSATDARAMADKLAGLRIFADDGGLMNRSLAETGGAVLLVSQFTLHGDARKGRRPSFITAAKEDVARPLYEAVGAHLSACGIAVAYGEFGATMAVESVNDGPVTILLDTKRAF